MKYTTIISGQDTQNKEWRLQCNSHDQYSQQQILLGLKFFFLTILTLSQTAFPVENQNWVSYII